MHVLLHSVPPILQQATGDPGLHWRLPPGRGWWWEKQSLALVGRPLLSKSLIQLSAQGWVAFPPWSFFGLRRPSPPRGFTPRGPCRLLLPVPPYLWWAPADHTSTGDPPTPAGSFAPVSYGVRLFSSESWYVQGFVCALQDWSLCFPQSVEVVIKSCCLQSQIPWEFSVPLLNPQAGKPDVGFRTFTTVGELLWYYWSPVCGSPTQRVAQVTQLCPTLCHPMDCSPPGSSVHGILQARILEWVAILFSRGSSQPRDQTQVSHIAGGFFTIWATRKAHLVGMGFDFYHDCAPPTILLWILLCLWM